MYSKDLIHGYEDVFVPYFVKEPNEKAEPGDGTI
jgi:hypothetical protein